MDSQPAPASFSSMALQSFNHFSSQLEILVHLPAFTPWTTAVGGLILWLSIVRALRWRRYDAIHRKYGPKWNNGLGTINPQEAQEIAHLSNVYDMPKPLYYSASFALFKTYGIPTISRLLAATKELKSKETVSRRYADLLGMHAPSSGFTDPSLFWSDEFKGLNARPADDPRANIALARVNWLHSKYKISNSDYLYTLCLFVTEPIRWSDRYGWRRLSALEKHAIYVFWAEIGRRMNIQDIPGSLEEMIMFTKEYEDAYMVPAETNRDVAGYTLNELLAPVPSALDLKAFATKIVISALADNTREAMMYEKPSWIFRILLNGIMAFVASVQRFLLLPRLYGSYVVEHGSTNISKFRSGECPRMHPSRYTTRPWYKPESSSAMGYYVNKLLVKIGYYLDMPCPRLKSEGYRLEELGPPKFEDAGHEEVMEIAAKIQGCPVTGPWSSDGRKKIY